MPDLTSMQAPVCPVPLSHSSIIVMGHGSGGQMTNNLINRVFLPRLGNPILNKGNDAGVIQHNPGNDQNIARIVVSTDSHVVSPLIFPGGDIGRLAVCGTVNDVAMLGATPLYLTAGFILEEGLQISLLEDIVDSMRIAADEAGIQIIAGDTKVVQKGKVDGLFITTAGIGFLSYPGEISGAHAKSGDIVILSGSIGDHGIAVLAARGEMGFSGDIKSDLAPLNHMVNDMLKASNEIHVLRDPTRGGLATTLNEIACQSQVCIFLQEETIPVKPVVAGACEMLGFDPLYVANEGKLIAIVAEKDAEKLLGIMRLNPYGKDAAIIGRVVASPPSQVHIKMPYGSTRVVTILSGELLPRIC